MRQLTVVMTKEGDQNMKYLAALLLFTTSLAFAQDEPKKVVQVQDRNFAWTIHVENCNIDPTLPVKVLTKQRNFPAEKIIVTQKGKRMRCDVERINVVIV